MVPYDSRRSHDDDDANDACLAQLCKAWPSLHPAVKEWLNAERVRIHNTNAMGKNPWLSRFDGASERVTIEHRAWLASLLRFRYNDSVSSGGDR